jgi:D-alanine-D-alanine ligase
MQIAIITGGRSAERKVALASLGGVKKALKGKLEFFVYDFPKDIDRFISERSKIDVVIPVMHGRGGEDGQLQGFLETLSIPYLFSGVEAHAIGIDKAATKAIVSAAGLRTPSSKVLSAKDEAVFTGPVVVKPIDAGSSQGIAIVKNAKDFTEAMKIAFTHSKRVLVEDFVEGREFTVAMIEEDGVLVALPVTEIVIEDGFFDYDKKYNVENLAEEICPAQIDAVLQLALETDAMIAHEVIGARHISRSDFIVDDSGVIWFLEINTIPGMTATSFLPKMIKESGRDFGNLLLEWIEELR